MPLIGPWGRAVDLIPSPSSSPLVPGWLSLVSDVNFNPTDI